MSDPFWTPFFTFAGMVVLAIVQAWAAANARKAATAAKSAVTAADATADQMATTAAQIKESVRQNGMQTVNARQALTANADATAKAVAHLTNVATATHKLANGNLLAQLRISATALARVAALTGDLADAEAAARAQRVLEEHEQGQPPATGAAAEGTAE